MNDIQASWQHNAQQWIHLLSNEDIPSRQITNPAIVDILTDLNPASLLDVGCGEGWLTRKMAQLGISTVGIDATELLIKQAKSLHPEGQYYLQSYEGIIAGTMLPESPYDAVVANFCLYQEWETPRLLNTLRSNLTPGGHIVIQTLHPFHILRDGLSYTSQWMDDAWKGLPGAFTHPYKWYYRTFESWLEVFSNSGLSVKKLQEPLNPDKPFPLSVIFVLS